MSYSIRPLQAEDYPATTDIYNQNNEPHHQVSNDELRRSDERSMQRPDFHLLSAVENGEVIGRAQFGERQVDNPPGKFWAWFFAREDRLGVGVDTALFDMAVEILQDRDPESIWTCIREDFVPAAAYLSECGYEEKFRSWGANIDLEGFDANAFRPYQHTLAQAGIELRKYTELASDPERDQKLAALQAELEEDAPHHEPIVPKHHPKPDHPRMLIDSYVVAVHNGEYVGMASLTDQPRFPTVAGSGLVGVRAAYRGHGLGTALVAHTTAWAKRQGYTEVNGGGAGTNAPMLKVIRRIGFDVEPAWITFATSL